MTCVGRQPAFEALRRRQAAVQRHHTLFAEVRKTFLEARLQLWCEVDLRHHDQHLCGGVLCQYLFRRMQVDLGLAAAGGAKQQGRAGIGFKS